MLSPLGAGGMGEVYRARDTHLGRQVAIKVISADLTTSSAAQRRFEQEARAIAALSHPNILAIHSFETHDGITFAVTELLLGETLHDRIARGKIPWRDASRIAAFIADGLAAAHENGVIHRDLKPANVFLTTDGQVKILDFGLARTAQPFSESTDIKTEPGTVLGTIAYMPPEQLRGEEVDARADIYALGCILDEMTEGAPRALTRMIHRCLEADRNARYHSARDLAMDLRSLHIPRRHGLIAAAIAVVVMAAVAMALLRRAAAPPAHHEVRSILVLPFENESRDPNAEYLSDGIAEGLISALAELPNLRVVARTTAFRFKGKPVDLPALRKQLDVDAVLAGRLLSQGRTITVQADLIDTDAGTELWGNRFHEQSASVLDIEQNIVAHISEALRGRLTRVPAPATTSPEAYKLYLEGRFYWSKRNPQAISKARELFQQAIAIDPQFALAYSGLADADNMLGGIFHVVPREEAFRLAREAAQTALRLNPDLAEAHASLGLLEENEFHWGPAERELKRALELNPNYTSALLWYSLLQLARNHVEESITLIRRAVQIDPLSAIMVTNFAMRLNVAGNYHEGLANSLKGIELDPGYNPAYTREGEAYEAIGEREKAAAAYQRGSMVPGPPGSAEAMLIRANVLLGNMVEAKSVLQHLEERAAQGKAERAMLAWAYSALGDRDRALDALNRAFVARESTARDSARTLQLKELRGDPRYDDFLRRLERGF